MLTTEAKYHITLICYEILNKKHWQEGYKEYNSEKYKPWSYFWSQEQTKHDMMRIHYILKAYRNMSPKLEQLYQQSKNNIFNKDYINPEIWNPDVGMFINKDECEKRVDKRNIQRQDLIEVINEMCLFFKIDCNFSDLAR